MLVRDWAAAASERVNKIVEFVVAGLMLALVLDVWLGVADRYYLRWQLPWPETLARYLMIWAALLAVSSGIARRDHIGLTAFVMAFPASVRRLVLMGIDLLSLALFAYVTWYGIAFAQSGAPRHAMIFGMSLAPFYAAIPVAAALCSFQLVLVFLRDLGGHLDTPVYSEPVMEDAQ